MGDNTVTPEQFAALKARFHGKMSVEEAMEVLHSTAFDETLPPIVRLQAAPAILELRSGRSVQSAMARFRRAVGLEPAKKSGGD